MFNVPTDKILHFCGGALISLGVTVVLGPVAGVCAALIVGCAKEWVWDAWMKRGNFEAWDAVATTLGGVAVAVFYAIAQKL